MFGLFFQKKASRDLVFDLWGHVALAYTKPNLLKRGTLYCGHSSMKKLRNAVIVPGKLEEPLSAFGVQTSRLSCV